MEKGYNYPFGETTNLKHESSDFRLLNFSRLLIFLMLDSISVVNFIHQVLLELSFPILREIVTVRGFGKNEKLS